MLSDDQRKFAENIASGMEKRDAYVDVFGKNNPRSDGVRASILAKNVEVIRYLDDLRQRASDVGNIKLTDILDKLQEAYEMTKKKEDGRGMAQISMSFATLAGFTKDGDVPHGAVKVITPDEILAKINERRKRFQS
jgi:hypothetical protein